MITGDTITDAQIRSVWADGHNDVTGRELMAALREPLWTDHVWTDDEVAAARARCAAIINERAAAPCIVCGGVSQGNTCCPPEVAP